MTGTIVVGVNDAEVSLRVIDWAIARAETRKQDVLLLGVVGGALGVVGEGAVLDAARASLEASLRAHAERVASSSVSVATKVAVGDPASALIEASQGAELLVIGSDYQGSGRGPARGSRGISIAAAVECPVVVVPDIEMGERRGVVVGVDGSEFSERAIAFAAEEADRAGEPLIAVHAWTLIPVTRNTAMVVPEEYREAVREASYQTIALSVAGLRAKHPGLEIQERVEEGFPAAVINEIAASARLTVVGSHGRGPIRRFFLGSVSHDILQNLVAPTVVVR